MKVPPSQRAPPGAFPGLSRLKSSQQPLIQDVVLRKPLFLWTIAPPVNQELGTSFPLTDSQDTSNEICRAAVNNVWGGGRSEGGTRSETGFSTDGRWDAACGRRKLKAHSRGVHNLIHFKGADEMRSQLTRRRWSKVCEQLHTLAWLTGGGQRSAPIVLLLGLSRGSQAAKHDQSTIRWAMPPHPPEHQPEGADPPG